MAKTIIQTESVEAAAAAAACAHTAVVATTTKRETKRKTLQREIEASVGKKLIETADKILLKKSKLVQKQVYLPKFGIHMHYLEREATAALPETLLGGGSTKNNKIPEKENSSSSSSSKTPTLLFCHGLAGNAERFTSLVSSMDIPPHVRILVPDQIGHGKDLQRAKNDPENFRQPTQEMMVESTSEFLDEVKVGHNCNALGVSMGGALVYYLRLKRPDVIQRTVLVSPSILHCMDDAFLEGVARGTNKFIACETRDDLKMLLRDMGPACVGVGGKDLSNAGRKIKDPIPAFFLESMYRKAKEEAPEGHHKEMLRTLLQNAGMTQSGRLNVVCDDDDDDCYYDACDDELFAIETDADADSPRLVIWPEKDAIVSCEKGKDFFRRSNKTIFRTIPDCGHAFNKNGKGVLDIIQPRVKEYILDFLYFSYARLSAQQQN